MTTKIINTAALFLAACSLFGVTPPSGSAITFRGSTGEAFAYVDESGNFEIDGLIVPDATEEELSGAQWNDDTELQFVYPELRHVSVRNATGEIVARFECPGPLNENSDGFIQLGNSVERQANLFLKGTVSFATPPLSLPVGKKGVQIVNPAGDCVAYIDEDGNFVLGGEDLSKPFAVLSSVDQLEEILADPDLHHPYLEGLGSSWIAENTPDGHMSALPDYCNTEAEAWEGCSDGEHAAELYIPHGDSFRVAADTQGDVTQFDPLGQSANDSSQYGVLRKTTNPLFAYYFFSPANTGGDNGGAWLYGVFRDPSNPGYLLGFYHAEDHIWKYPGGGQHNFNGQIPAAHMAMALAKSADNGETWLKLGPVLTAKKLSPTECDYPPYAGNSLDDCPKFSGPANFCVFRGRDTEGEGEDDVNGRWYCMYAAGSLKMARFDAEGELQNDEFPAATDLDDFRQQWDKLDTSRSQDGEDFVWEGGEDFDTNGLESTEREEPFNSDIHAIPDLFAYKGDNPSVTYYDELGGHYVCVYHTYDSTCQREQEGEGICQCCAEAPDYSVCSIMLATSRNLKDWKLWGTIAKGRPNGSVVDVPVGCRYICDAEEGEGPLDCGGASTSSFEQQIIAEKMDSNNEKAITTECQVPCMSMPIGHKFYDRHMFPSIISMEFESDKETGARSWLFYRYHQHDQMYWETQCVPKDSDAVGAFKGARSMRRPIYFRVTPVPEA